MKETLVRTETDVLHAHMSVLIVKNEIGLNTPFIEIQQKLLDRFNINYSLDDIEAEILDQWYTTDTIEEEEDFFEGW